MDNYFQWKLMKDVKWLHLKPGVIPHIFDCQKKSLQPAVERTANKKRKHIHLVQEAIASSTKCDTTTVDYDVPSTSGCVASSSVDVTPPTSLTSDKCIQVHLKKTF